MSNLSFVRSPCPSMMSSWSCESCQQKPERNCAVIETKKPTCYRIFPFKTPCKKTSASSKSWSPWQADWNMKKFQGKRSSLFKYEIYHRQGPKKKTLHPEKCLTKHRHFTSHPMATWWLKLDSFPVISYKPSFSFVTIFQGLGQLNHYSGIPLDSCMNSYESIILTYHFWMDPTCAASKRCAAKAPAPCCKSLRAWNLEFWDGRWTFERIFHWFLEGF